MKIVILLLFLAAISVCGAAQIDSEQPLTRVDRTGDEKGRSFFIFFTSNLSYTIRHDGYGEMWSSKSRKNFNLRMDGASRLDRMFFSEVDSDLILEYEVTDRKADWGYVLRMDQKKQKIKWIKPLSAYKLGPGLIVGNELYFSASNFLAKLDMNTGSLLWQQPQPDHDWSFGLPSLKGETVTFEEERQTGRLVEVDKNTGRVITNK